MDRDETNAEFQQVKQEIQTSIALERDQTRRLTLTTLFTGDGSPTKNVHRIWLSILINISNPFFGSSLITFYGSAFLKGVGLQGEEVNLALAAINTGVTIGMLLSMFILPRVGRRPMLCWGATVGIENAFTTYHANRDDFQALTILMCIYTGLANIKNPSKGVQWTSVVILILFNIVNGASCIWLAFLYGVEVLPLQYRSQVQSGSEIVFWFISFLVVYFGGQAAQNANVRALIYIWFCLGGALMTTLFWIFVKESEQRSTNPLCVEIADHMALTSSQEPQS
jgi:MFS family permease